MADNDILAEIEPRVIREFSKDFLQMMRLAKEIDIYYAKWENIIDRYVKKLQELVDLFNKKYKGIKLKIEKDIDSIRVRLFLNESSIKDFMSNVASKIMGLKAIGATNFDLATVAETDKFMSEINRLRDKLYLTYYLQDIGTINVFVIYDKKEEKIELVYDFDEIVNEPNPEFKIAAFYALKNGYDKKIKLHDEGSTLGFKSYFSEKEKRKYFDRFNPPFME